MTWRLHTTSGEIRVWPQGCHGGRCIVCGKVQADKRGAHKGRAGQVRSKTITSSESKDSPGRISSLPSLLLNFWEALPRRRGVVLSSPPRYLHSSFPPCS